MATRETDDDFPSEVRNTAGLPHRVRTRGLELLYILINCAVGLSLAGVAAYQLLITPSPNSLWVQIIFLIWGAGAFYRLCLLLGPALIFKTDRIEQRTWFGWRTLTRRDIQGTRPSSDKTNEFIAIVPREPGVQPIVVRKALLSDPVAARWLAGAPDLSVDAIAADKSAILGDNRYGATTAERQSRLDRAKAIVWVFSAVCIVAGVWMVFSPERYEDRLALIVAAPLIGGLLVQTSDGLIKWFPETKVRPSVAAAFFPVTTLIYPTFDVSLADPKPFIAVAAVCVVGAFLALCRDPAVLVLAPPVVIWGGFSAYGLAVLINLALAPQGNRIFQRNVLALYESGGGKNRSYNVKVAPLPGRLDASFKTSSDYYDHATVGDVVCVVRRRGALGVDWYQVKACSVITPMTLQGQAAPSPVDLVMKSEILTGNEGSAKVRCSVINESSLTDCRAISETPVGVGAAAVQKVADPSTAVIDPARLKGLKQVGILVTLTRWLPPSERPPPNYPAAAWKAQKEGQATIKCQVVDDVRLANCSILSETPAGLGFGAMAVDMANNGRLHPKTEEMRGHLLVSIPVNFKLAN